MMSMRSLYITALLLVVAASTAAAQEGAGTGKRPPSQPQNPAPGQSSGEQASPDNPQANLPGTAWKKLSQAAQERSGSAQAPAQTPAQQRRVLPPTVISSPVRPAPYAAAPRPAAPPVAQPVQPPTTMNSGSPAANTPSQAAVQRPPSVPPSPPRVSYAGGQLTIVAANSGLSDILNSVRNLVGVRVEGSNYASGERVFGQFGPGAPRDVLNALLSGSKYDFVLVGSLENPASVNHIVLSPHVTGAPGQVAQAGQPQVQPPQEIQEDTDQDTPEQAEPQPVQAAPGQQAPSETISPQQAPPTGQQPIQPQGQQQGQGQPKTPEQLLEELKRLQQQQQQQQQQQVPK